MSTAEGEAYVNAIGGSLSLKGGALKTVGKKKSSDSKKSKKKKKKEKKKKREREAKEAELALAGSAGSKRGREIDSDDDDDEERERFEAEAADTRTPAERAADEIRMKRQKQDIDKWTEKSHREKINDFNNYLNSLSEHHDVPKVANAGLG